MKNIFILFLLIAGQSICLSQERNIEGTYGKCIGQFDCLQIHLKKDKTFNYYIDEKIGKGLVYGKWQQIKDTLFLYIQKPKLLDVITKHESHEQNSTYKELVFEGYTSKDTFSLEIVYVIINDTNTFRTESNGTLRLPLDYVIKTIRVNSVVKDTTIAITDVSANKIRFLYPIDFLPAIYQAPEKWLIEGKYLIPFWLTDGRYELDREGAKKKVSRRRTIPELLE